MCPLILLLKVSREKKSFSSCHYHTISIFNIFFPFLFQNSEILSRKSSASSTGSLDRNNEKLKNSCSSGRNNTPQKIANSVKARIAMYVLITCFSPILKFIFVIVFLERKKCLFDKNNINIGILYSILILMLLACHKKSYLTKFRS